MKAGRVVFGVIGILFVAVIVVALAVPGIVFPSKWTVEQKIIEGRTVFELRRTGMQVYPKLSPDNSHKLLIEQWGNSWFDEAAHDYLFDLSDFNRLVSDPNSCSTMISTFTTGGNFSSEGDKIVWAEHPSGGDVLQSVRGFDLKTMKPFEIDTRDSLFFKSSPTASGNFVAYQGTDGNSDNQVQLYDMSKKQWRQLTLDSKENRERPTVIGTKIVWADYRNKATTDYDLYGYDLETNREFVVYADKGVQRSFEFNGQYVLFGGDEFKDPENDNNYLMKGLYAFDIKTGIKIEILPKTYVFEDIFMLASGDDPLIAWTEQIKNKSGTFLAVKYKRLSEKESHFVSDPSTQNLHVSLSSITNKHICYDVSENWNTSGKPYVFNIADQKSFELDDRDCGNIVADDEYVVWNAIDNGVDRICGTKLP